MSNLVARILSWDKQGEEIDRTSEKTSIAPEKKPSLLSSGPVGPIGPIDKVEWPQECLESEKQIGSLHARLFPLLGQEVLTPSARGILVQVFASRVAVNVEGTIVFLKPNVVRPSSTAGKNPDTRGTALDEGQQAEGAQ